MEDQFIDNLYNQHQKCPKCPSPAVVTGFFSDLLETLFPDLSMNRFSSAQDLRLHLQKLKISLTEILSRNPKQQELDFEVVAERFFDELPETYHKISLDAQAMFAGDPAARSVSEVIRTYPGFYALAAYRVAHALFKQGVQIIPRMITEHAHGKTGIDIHPGAQIGLNCCIDHGTGVVIGETTVIGDHVKIYQGVTLGALSVDKKDAETKRHPTIQDRVVIYAGATILGGETTIGADSIIGGNVWITRSVPPQSKIYYQAKMYNQNTEQSELYIFKESAT